METKGFFQFEIIINVWLALSASLEFLCCLRSLDLSIIMVNSFSAEIDFIQHGDRVKGLKGYTIAIAI